MRIGHYMTGLWERGGIATYIGRVAEAQRQDGHEVVFIDGGATDAAAPADAPDSFRAAGESQLFEIAARAKLDVLHAHTLVRLPGGMAPLPMLRTLHGHEPYCPSGGRFLGKTQTPCNRGYSLAGCAWGHVVDRCGSVRPVNMLANFRRTWAERSNLRTIRVAAVSDFLRRQMIANGYAADRVHALHLFSPGVVEQSVAPAEGVPRFLFLGRITPHKGVDWLLRAAAAVPAPIHLDIAGEGNHMDFVRQLCRELGLEDRVTFHGWLKPKQVDELFRASRGLVFPSLWHEAAGLGVLEAMAHGRPVIVSRVGGTPEMVREGETGLVVEPGDVAGLAKAMTLFAADHELATRFGNAGRQLADGRFTLRRHMDGLYELYDMCIADAARLREVKPDNMNNHPRISAMT